MRYILLAILVTGSAALSGCFNDNNNSSNSRPPVQPDTNVSPDQADAQLAVSRVNAVIDASKNVDTDEPQDIDRIILPAANLAEPVAVKGANASL